MEFSLECFLGLRVELPLALAEGAAGGDPNEPEGDEVNDRQDEGELRDPPGDEVEHEPRPINIPGRGTNASYRRRRGLFAPSPSGRGLGTWIDSRSPSP